MAKSDNEGSGESGKHRPQVQPSVAVGKPAATESTRGDTVGRSGGPTELPLQFGRYRVKTKLGVGGMGTVYLVENTQLQREEALKVPHFGDGDNAELHERFLREARSAAKLDHANLCPVYDVGVQDGIYYLTMRFLKGKLLSDYSGKAQPARKAVEIVTKLAQALETAHGKGVIHRDLKPSNVMMVGGVGPVVMDFGLAKQIRQPDKTLTQVGSLLGTPAYMPPEQVNGDLARMGPPSDVYSLGVILYELLTGRLPFEGTMAAIFGQILYIEAPLPSAVVPGLSPALDGICRKAMAKEPAARHVSMKAFAAALMDYLRATPAASGGVNLVATSVDKAAIFQAATVAPGPLPLGQADIFQAATVVPAPRASATVPPQARFSDAEEAHRKCKAAALWFMSAGIGNLAVMTGILAVALRLVFLFRGALDERILFMLFAGVPGAVAACHFWASGSLKNVRDKAKVIIAIELGFVLGLLSAIFAIFFWIGLVGGPSSSPKALCFFWLLVTMVTSFVNFFAAIWGILILKNATVHAEFGRPANTTHEPMPVFSKNLVIGLAGGLAGWFVLVLLLTFASLD